MFFLISNGQPRPSILENNKDQEYHLKFGRFCVGQANNLYQNEFVEKVRLNKNFYKGNQWILQEDTESFFKDETNQNRNRIKVVRNLIRPMVEQYRGNAIRMSINFDVKSVSPHAINRREQHLAEQLWYSKIANEEGNPFGEDLKKKKAIGDSDAETEAIFSNLYVDRYVNTMNDLLKYISERNEFSNTQMPLAENLALTGLGVKKTFEYGGHQEFYVVQSENFFFDRSAKRYDLKDAGFMGEVVYMEASEIYEAYPDLTDDQRRAIQSYADQYRKMVFQTGITGTANHQNTQYSNSGKVPVFQVYWKDGETYEYGYVKDEYGYDYFTRINFVYPGEDKPRYTDKDLIENKSQRAQKILNGKMKRKLYVDVMRTCHFIPQEIVTSSSDLAVKNLPDIVLDYGIAPYQEANNIEFNSVEYPYKCYCWGYVDGEILSPVDDAISPQRFINRIMSITENQLNNSRGSGTVIDDSMVMNKEEVLNSINQSKPIFINAKGRGIQNAIGAYDTTVKQGTMVLFNIMDAMKNSLQEITGVNEALKGESTGSDQLVGVTQLLIQRGSLMQEPFYHAITRIEEQCYQSMCTIGKRIYCDSERNLAIAVGDEGVRTIRISRDMLPEDFRCFIKRENSEEMLINAGNQMLSAFLQMQIIDQKQYANLYGRSTPDYIAYAIRENAKQKEELARMQAKEQAKKEADLASQVEKEGAMQQYQAHEQQARADVMDMQNRQHDLKKEFVKQLGKIAPQNPIAQNEIIKNTQNLQNQNA
jgi:hypothetical protein